MRPRVCLLASAVFILLINAAPLPAATAESVNVASVDACSLLTQAQLSAAVGFSMESYFSRHDYSGTTNPCTWTRLPPKTAESSPPGPTLVSLKLSVMSAESFGGGFGADKINPAHEITSVSGLGDDAYYATTALNAGASVTVLNVKKGGLCVQVTWLGTTDHQTVMNAEKTIAAQVLLGL